MTKVLKFGGTSLSSRSSLETLASILEGEQKRGERAVLVVSAFEGQTDELVEIAERAAQGNPFYRDRAAELGRFHHRMVAEVTDAANREQLRTAVDALLADLDNVLHGISLVRDLSRKTLDFVMSFGERLSSLVVCYFLRNRLKDVWHLDARTVVRTDAQFGRARVDAEWTGEAIRKILSERQGMPVVTGFIGSTSRSETTTLGRGGSDYTAALFAAALDASEIQLWTTVDGVMTADPKKVSKAITIPQITYEEALELGHFGAKVIFAPALQPALAKSIPVRIKNSLRPDASGTVVSEARTESSFPITGIASMSEIGLMQLQGSGLIGVAGTARRLFDALSRAGVNVILISQASSEHSICFAVSPERLDAARESVEIEFAHEIRAEQVTLSVYERPHSIVAAVGSRMRNIPGISGKLFQALGKNGINVVAIVQGSSELNISVVVSRDDEGKALNALHDAFFLSGTKTIHLFVAGAGLVGGKLLEQIANQAETNRNRGLELRIVGIANSRKMLLDPNGITLNRWRDLLDSKSEPSNFGRFVDAMRDLNLPNSVFVDCTASDEVASCYVKILQSSISIATANKRGNAGSLESYQDLRRSAARGNVKFFYETNVGAGLPVIGTLNDLLASGDQVVKIEAVLSGTLSYIFNTFRPGLRFSEIVREAKARGYTEPDPRDDLSGTDVARKLLILAREIGLPLEERDIGVQSLVPAVTRSATSAEEFLDLLPRADDELEAMIQGAASRGEVLRYIGSIENGRAQVSLRAVDAHHPFYSLSGSDNVISFVTTRYFDRPLVVKGPGAGTDVTAAGVLADILRIASYLG